MQKKAIIKGTIVVLIASIIIRILGFFFRIYIAEKIGAQGMGIYQLIMSLYMMVATFATSGITFSVSRMIAENFAINKHGSPGKILKISMIWILSTSTLVSAALLIFAKPIGIFLLHEKQTISSIWFIAPGVPFMAAAACLKGYFFAVRKASHPSNAGIIEQTIKMIAAFCLITFFIVKKTSTACALISISMTAGEVASALYLAAFFYLEKFFKNKQQFKSTKPQKAKHIFNTMLKISIPIQLSSTLNAALRLVESVLVIECFKIFTAGNSTVATATYGIIRGMALPLILFPTSFLQAIITVLVPELSGANASKQWRSVMIACEKALQLTILLGIYSSAIFLTFSNQIATMFYSNQQVGPIMKSLAGLCPFLYVQIMIIGILNSIGKQIAAMKYNIIDAVTRIILIAIFVPQGGLNNFIIVMYVSNIFTFLLYLGCMLKTTSLPLSFNKLILKPLAAITIASAFGAVLQPLLKQTLSNFLQIAVSSSITGIVFLILLLCFNCLSLKMFNLKPDRKLQTT